MDTILDVMKIGDRLKALRVERLLTAAELARMSGVGMNTIYRIERNEVEPHFGTIRKLAKALEIEPQELLR